VAEKKTFGGVVASARKALRLSQKELASLVIKEDGTPITPQYLNDIEHDRRSPTTDHTVTALAKALGEDPAYFFVLAGKVHPDDVRRAALADPQRVKKAVIAFRRTLRET
jgi:transcriptional regulator with XRE-family HTH domain